MRSISLRFTSRDIYHVQKRENETDVTALQKWTKTGSLRRNRGMKIYNPLSHSHESLIAGDGEQAIHKLLPANSVNSIVAHIDQTDGKDDIGRVAGWAVNFDKLLHDKAGIVVFTEFLKKEFSEENIVFWRLCEQYKRLSSNDERKLKAKVIYSKHLSPKASEPVNVDSTSRLNAEKCLDDPSPTMFDMAQKHIFQLMKQDSYMRFLKGDMYRKFLMREMEGRQLELPHDPMEDALADKEEKKKGKENEKRRRSLLPWRQNKHKNGNKLPSDIDFKRGFKDIKVKDKEVNNNLKKCPGPGIDLSTMRKEVFQTKEEMRDTSDGQFKFCRVVLPDGSTTVVCAKPGQSSRSVLGKLCEKRGLSIASVDVFLLGSDKPLDLSEDVSTLGSREVVIERRVLFRMDFPNKKSIGVKAKPNRTIRDVFKPILNKYGYRIDGILVQLSGHDDFLDTETMVLALDNQRVVVLSKEDPIDGVVEERLGALPRQHRPPLPPTTSRLKPGNQGNSKPGSLDEITNRIFEDLMKGKSETAHRFDELGIMELDKTKVHKNPDARRLSGLFALLRKESLGKAAKDNKPRSTAGKVKTTLAPTPATEAKNTRSDHDNEKLFELLSRAQSHRLDDQRGVGMETVDIPEFLKSEPPEPTCEPPGGRLSTADMFDHVEYIQGQGQGCQSQAPRTPKSRVSQPRKFNKFTTFGSPGFVHSNQSFTSDSILPSQEVGDNFFRMQPVVLDADEFDVENIENFYLTSSQQDHHWKSTPRSDRSWDWLNNAPLASPEKYSPQKRLQSQQVYEQQMCAAIDKNFKGIPPPPPPYRNPPPPPPPHTPRVAFQSGPQYTPPTPLSGIENKNHEMIIGHSERSGFRRVLRSGNELGDELGNGISSADNEAADQTSRAALVGQPGATPKYHLSSRVSLAPFLVDDLCGDETVTFV